MTDKKEDFDIFGIFSNKEPFGYQKSRTKTSITGFLSIFILMMCGCFLVKNLK